MKQPDYLETALRKMEQTIQRMRRKTHILLLRTDYLE